MTTVSPRSCDPHPPRGRHLALELSFVQPSSLAMSPKASSTTFESCWRSGPSPSRHAYPSECTRVRLGWSVGGAVQKDSHPRCIQTTPSERPARRDSTALGKPVIWCFCTLDPWRSERSGLQVNGAIPNTSWSVYIWRRLATYGIAHCHTLALSPLWA
jgi:hypothetical protein